MGIAERKEREKEQRRKAILDAAEKVFFEKGLKYSTMDDVAEEAELSKGTLYLYFKNKEELFAVSGHKRRKMIRSNAANVHIPHGASRELVSHTGLSIEELKQCVELHQLIRRGKLRVMEDSSKGKPAKKKPEVVAPPEPPPEEPKVAEAPPEAPPEEPKVEEPVPDAPPEPPPDLRADRIGHRRSRHTGSGSPLPSDWLRR